MPPPDPEITGLLRSWRSGDSEALQRLMPLVYSRLHAMAVHFMHQEKPGQTLQATALVHEAYLRLISTDVTWEDRVHFLSVAAKTMRRILLDQAKARQRAKRGGGLRNMSLEDVPEPAQPADSDFLNLDAALTRLCQQDPRRGELVELFYFGGVTGDEAAEILGVSRATVNRDLKLGKAWLRSELQTYSK